MYSKKETSTHIYNLFEFGIFVVSFFDVQILICR